MAIQKVNLPDLVAHSNGDFKELACGGKLLVVWTRREKKNSGKPLDSKVATVVSGKKVRRVWSPSAGYS